jgi:DNA-binding MarR family transcriptional regulator
MTRIVRELEAGGLVRRRTDAKDRRVTRIHATPAGVRLLESGRSRRVTLLAEWIESLGKTEVRRLAGALGVLERLGAAR